MSVEEDVEEFSDVGDSPAVGERYTAVQLQQLFVPRLERDFIEVDSHGCLGKAGKATDNQSLLSWLGTRCEYLEARDYGPSTPPALVTNPVDVVRVFETVGDRGTEGEVVGTDKERVNDNVGIIWVASVGHDLRSAQRRCSIVVISNSLLFRRARVVGALVTLP